MKIGIIIGLVLGVVLLLIGGITLCVTLLKKGKLTWEPWVAFAGLCAILTAGINAIVRLF